MAMPPQFAKTPGKGMPPSKPGDKPNPFAKKGAAPAKGKGKAPMKGAPGKAPPAKGKKGVNPFAK